MQRTCHNKDLRGREAGNHRRGRRRSGKRPGQRPAQGIANLFPGNQQHAPGGFQGARHRRSRRNRLQGSRAHRFRGSGSHLEYYRRVQRYHRGQLEGSGGQLSVQTFRRKNIGYSRRIEHRSDKND